MSIRTVNRNEKTALSTTSQSARLGFARLGQSAFAALLISALLVGVGLLATAADFELGSATGIWTSTNGTVDGVGTNYIEWGTSTGYGRSGFEFQGSTGASFASGETFVVGTFIHHNKPIYGSDLPTLMDLQVTLNFTAPSVVPDPVFTYTLQFDETTNTSNLGDCPAFQESSTPCDDRVIFPTPTGAQTFWVGDSKYELEILGFSLNTSGTNPALEFITEERLDNVAYLVGRLTFICTLPQITSGPSNLSVYETETATFNASATGTNLSYQWYKDGSPLSDDAYISGSSTETLTIVNTALSDSGTYTVVVTGDCGTDQASATLSVSEADCANYQVDYLGSTYDGSTTTFNYSVTAYQNPAVSHWVLGLPDCIVESDIASATSIPSYGWIFGLDPTTGVWGIKFDDTQIEAGETEYFSISLYGYWPEATSAVETAIKAATKMGSKECYFDTVGPSCNIADLELTKTVDSPTAEVGSEVTFTISVYNDGRSAATGVEVVDSLPSGFEYVSHLASQGSYDDISGVWAVGTLPVYATETLRITATVLDSGEYENWAEVTASDQYDPDSTPNNGDPTEDDQDSASVTPLILPAIDIEKATNGEDADGAPGPYDSSEPLPAWRRVTRTR